MVPSSPKPLAGFMVVGGMAAGMNEKMSRSCADKNDVCDCSVGGSGGVARLGGVAAIVFRGRLRRRSAA